MWTPLRISISRAPVDVENGCYGELLCRRLSHSGAGLNSFRMHTSDATGQPLDRGATPPKYRAACTARIVEILVVLLAPVRGSRAAPHVRSITFRVQTDDRSSHWLPDWPSLAAALDGRSRPV